MWAQGLIVAVVLVVVLGIIGAAFLSTRQQPTDGDVQPPPPPPPTTSKSAAEINLALSDFAKAGWVKYSEGTLTVSAAGLVENNTRTFYEDVGYRVTILDSDVLKFDSVPHAQVYYSTTESDIKARFSSEQPGVGSVSIFYKESADVWHIYFQSKNVVVHLRVVDPSIYFQPDFVDLAKRVAARI